ncbi:respiratory supercomplex factor 2, mitochondrial [[Candida] anglica]|uniref:Respiratory supercomplex factor 2, mitochondrial n=1 Tax=[Candida] anglica TaxID=148631 RepID=A0ABP0E6U9_9ASCO
MKEITAEESNAHWDYTIAEGVKGTLIGGSVSFGTFFFLKRYRPAYFKSFSSTIKSAMLIMPTITLCSFWAEEGSREFDLKLHSKGENIMEEYRIWNEKSISEKIREITWANQYKIVLGAYGLSIFGAEEYATKKIGLEAQRIARRNALGGATFLAIAVLVALSRPNVDAEKNNEWKKFLEPKSSATETKALE